MNPQESLQEKKESRAAASRVIETGIKKKKEPIVICYSLIIIIISDASVYIGCSIG